MQITVQRGAGDYPGPAITSELLASEAALLDRARQELDYNGPDRMVVQVSNGSLPHVYPGELVRVESVEYSDTGMLRGWAKTGSLSVSDDGTAEWRVETNVNVELLDDDQAR